MIRLLPALIGLGLAVLWELGRLQDAPAWMTWSLGMAALLACALVWLVPARDYAPLAGACLAALGAALVGLWAVGLGTAPWLAWWTFVFGSLAVASALPVAYQGLIERLRAREDI